MANDCLPRCLFAAAGAGALLTAAINAQPQLADRAATRSVDLSNVRAIRAPSAEVIRNLAERVDAAPATEVAAGPAPAAPSPATPAAVIPEVEPGKLYHVDLSVPDEQTIEKQLASQPDLQAQGTSLVMLPGLYRQLASNGLELKLKPVLIPQTVTFNSGTKMFVGIIKVGVHEIDGPAPAQKLSAPISFEVVSGGDAEPEELLIEHSGFPLRKFKISSPVAANGLNVTVASPFSPQGVPILLELGPTFRLSVTKSIEGLGLEAANVSVMAAGLPKPEGRIVQLTVDGPAKAEEDQLKLDANGNASTKLRSTGVGPISVTALLDGFQPVPADINAAFPVLTLTASALGGLAGGITRLLPGLRRNSGRRFAFGLLVAVILGLIVFGLYSVGVNVLPFKPTVNVGAVLVFVVSAMGAYLGSGVLGPQRQVEVG